MVCRLLQIGDLDGFVFICLQSGPLKREAHGGPVTSCAHCHRRCSHERVTSALTSLLREDHEKKILEVFQIFVQTCFTTLVLVDVLTWLLNSSASGRSNGKSRTAGLKKIQIIINASNYLIAHFRCTWKQADYICGPFSTKWHCSPTFKPFDMTSPRNVAFVPHGNVNMGISSSLSRSSVGHLNCGCV